jgi:hypothetical protein
MRFELSTDSRVFVDLRAAGLLKAVGHDATLSARPEAATIDPDDGRVVVKFPVRAIEPPPNMPEPDQQKMMDNLRGVDVLDAKRFPVVELRAHYEGTVDGGELRGELLVRGQPRLIAMTVSTTRQWDILVATGVWEGTLGELGIKPFKALWGALRLEDWIRLRLEARFRCEAIDGGTA